jgi:integrase
MKVADVRHSDVERRHARISKTAPYCADRTVAVLSKNDGAGCYVENSTHNPVKGVERAGKQAREISVARRDGPVEQSPGRPSREASANAVRLLLLTGARRGETPAAVWAQIDLTARVWPKRTPTTKQKREHRVPAVRLA